MIDELLKKYNLKYEELSPEERTTFHSMLDAVEGKALTIEKIKDYITNMKYAVEQEITTTPSNLFSWLFGWKKDYNLKARLKNYMLFEAFLLGPEKARKALEQSLSNIKK